MEETEIQKFYRYKNVFLTGGTGFLGKVVIEKLLRVTNVDRIYILIRAKKGKNIHERIKEIFDDPLFGKLNKIDAFAYNRLEPITGDCSLPNLGLSSEDIEILIEKIHIVIHGAATVRFNEPLYRAVKINVQATLDLLELSSKMQRLEAFVHVSSAFANCLDKHIEERYYVEKLGITSKQICGLCDLLGENFTNKFSSELVKEFPNSYCFTKALAEEAVLNCDKKLPICIFRPGIIVATAEEPECGWIDNFYGPVGILYGAVHGVVRVLYADGATNCCIIPVDFCASEILACAWQTANERKIEGFSQPPRIYHLVPDVRNVINWFKYKHSVEEHGPKMPLTRMIWFPFLTVTKSKLYYDILCFLYHTIPGYLYDLYFILVGKRRRMTKLYRKIRKQTLFLEYFSLNNFTFNLDNTKKLCAQMSPEDQNLFKFDVMTIDWSQYFYNSLCGMRLFLGKEEPSTIPRGISLLKRFYVLHLTFKWFICGGGATIIFWIISKVLRCF